MNDEDVTLHFRWGGKDGKWRWMAEVGDIARAGEERHITQAYEAAISAAQEMR